jgi:hypothetical protein
MIAVDESSSRPGDRLMFMAEIWTVRAILFSRDWRAFFSIYSGEGTTDCTAADGSDGGYQLLPKQPAPPVAARDRVPDLAETLAPSPAVGCGPGGQGDPGSASHLAGETTEPAAVGPIFDRLAPRPWRPAREHEST